VIRFLLQLGLNVNIKDDVSTAACGVAVMVEMVIGGGGGEG
jgi:hypothetical protein